MLIRTGQKTNEFQLLKRNRWNDSIVIKIRLKVITINRQTGLSNDSFGD